MRENLQHRDLPGSWESPQESTIRPAASDISSHQTRFPWDTTQALLRSWARDLDKFEAPLLDDHAAKGVKLAIELADAMENRLSKTSPDIFFQAADYDRLTRVDYPDALNLLLVITQSYDEISLVAAESKHNANPWRLVLMVSTLAAVMLHLIASLDWRIIQQVVSSR